MHFHKVLNLALAGLASISVSLAPVMASAASGDVQLNWKDSATVFGTTETNIISTSLGAGKFIGYAKTVLTNNSSSSQTITCSALITSTSEDRATITLAAGQSESITLHVGGTTGATQNFILSCHSSGFNISATWSKLTWQQVTNITIFQRF